MNRRIPVLWLTLASSMLMLKLHAQENNPPSLNSPIEKIESNEDAQQQEKLAEEKLEAASKAKHEAEIKELKAIRETTVGTEYTLSPGAVEMVVELDPKNYGFRTRNFRSVLGADFDFLFRGRATLFYSHRLAEYFTLSFLTGVDWSQVSLYEKFRQNLSKPAPKQLSLLAGVSGKWRLSEWYLRSAVFLEPSVLIGHMWQKVLDQKSTHWRIRPGLFIGIDSIFDSGLALTLKTGVEFPVDFAKGNAYKELAEPILMLGLGFAI